MSNLKRPWQVRDFMANPLESHIVCDAVEVRKYILDLEDALAGAAVISNTAGSRIKELEAMVSQPAPSAPISVSVSDPERDYAISVLEEELAAANKRADGFQGELRIMQNGYSDVVSLAGNAIENSGDIECGKELDRIEAEVKDQLKALAQPAAPEPASENGKESAAA